MIISYFNIKGIRILPVKTNTVFLIYSDAELPFTVPAQFFQLIARRNS